MNGDMVRLREWHVEQAVARHTSGQVDAIIRNARTNAAHALRAGDAVWRQAAPNAADMLAVLARIDELELAFLGATGRCVSGTSRTDEAGR